MGWVECGVIVHDWFSGMIKRGLDLRIDNKHCVTGLDENGNYARQSVLALQPQSNEPIEGVSVTCLVGTTP